MLEFLSSKVVSAVAVLVLVASALGFFSIERGAMEEGHFRDMCQSLGGAMDTLSTVNSGMQFNVTFSDEKAGLRLDGSFRNIGYEVEIRPGQVIFRQEGLTAVHALAQNVHVWDPRLVWNGTAYVSAGGLAILDKDHPVLRTRSGNDFLIERMLVVVSGMPAYRTFVHF
jgi:hypothetical protein